MLVRGCTVEIAVDSMGEVSTGARVEEIREKYAKRSRTLQKVGTRAAKRRLVTFPASSRDSSPSLTRPYPSRSSPKLNATRSSIAIEGVSGIGARVKANKRELPRLTNWGFSRLAAEHLNTRRSVPVSLSRWSIPTRAAEGLLLRSLRASR
jgi:hypothetical protein